MICRTVGIHLHSDTFQQRRHYQSVLLQKKAGGLRGQIWIDQCAFMPRVCCHGGSLSLKLNEHIAWRFIRNDIVL